MVFTNSLDGASKFKDEPSLMDKEDRHRPVHRIRAIKLIEKGPNTLSERQNRVKNALEESDDEEYWMNGICADNDSDDPYQMHWDDIHDR